MLVFLYGLSLYAEMPRYWETIAVSALLLTLFGAGCVRLVPALSSTAMGEEEEHLRREGDRTFRRCGTRCNDAVPRYNETVHYTVRVLTNSKGCASP